MSWIDSKTGTGYDLQRANHNGLIIREMLNKNSFRDVEFALSHFTFFQKSSQTDEMKARLPVDILDSSPYSATLELISDLGFMRERPALLKQVHFHNFSSLSVMESLSQISPLLHEQLKLLFQDAYVTTVVDNESSIAIKALKRFCKAYGSSNLKLYTKSVDSSNDLKRVKYQRADCIDEKTGITTKWSRFSDKASRWIGNGKRFNPEVLDLFANDRIVKDLYSEGLESTSFKSAVRVSLQNGCQKGIESPLVQLTTLKKPIHDMYIEFSKLPSVDIRFEGKKPYVYNSVVKRRLMMVNREWSPETPRGGLAAEDTQVNGPSVYFSDNNFTDFLFEGIPVTVTTRTTWRTVTNLDWKVLEMRNGGEPIVFRMPSLENLTLTAVGAPDCDWPMFKAPNLKQLNVIFTKECIDVVGRVNGLFHYDEEPHSLLKLSISAYSNTSGGVIDSPFNDFIYKSLKLLAIENMSAHYLFSDHHCPVFDTLEVLEYEPLCSFTLDNQNQKYPYKESISPDIYPNIRRIYLRKIFQDEVGFSPLSVISLTVPGTCHCIQADICIYLPIEANKRLLEASLESLQQPFVGFTRLSGSGVFKEDLESTGRFREDPRE